VLIYLHGGGGITGDKAGTSYLMRSLARQGVVAVTINYRLNARAGALLDDQVADVAKGFRWVYDHAPGYGGDRNNLFVWALNPGSTLLAFLITDTSTVQDPLVPPVPVGFGRPRAFLAEVGLSPGNVRGAVLLGGAGDTAKPNRDQPAVLLLDGDQGTEATIVPVLTRPESFYSTSKAAGADIDWKIVPGRDHFTLVSNIARDDDPAREHLFCFMRRQLMLGGGG
jgi:acetyl esterase/lipase